MYIHVVCFIKTCHSGIICRIRVKQAYKAWKAFMYPLYLQLFAKLMRLEAKIKCYYKCEDFVSGAISRDLGFLDNEMISLPFNVD